MSLGPVRALAALIGAFTASAIRQAKKPELRAWCLQLGLGDSGTAADLRQRILLDIEGREEGPLIHPDETGLAEGAEDVRTEAQQDDTPPEKAPDEQAPSEAEDVAEPVEAEDAIAEAGAAGPEDVEAQLPDKPEDKPGHGRVKAPFVVLGEAEEPRGAQRRRKKSKRKKAKAQKKPRRGREGKTESETAPEGTAEVASIEPELEQVIEETDEPEVKSADQESVPAPAGPTGPTPEFTVKQIWDAPKTQLREWCQQLGIDDTGPIMNLRIRLLSRIE